MFLKNTNGKVDVKYHRLNCQSMSFYFYFPTYFIENKTYFSEFDFWFEHISLLRWFIQKDWVQVLQN